MTDRIPHHSEPAREAVDARKIKLPNGYYLFQHQPSDMTCSLHMPDGLHIGNLRAEFAGDFVASLSASPAPAASGGLEAARELPFGFKAPFHVEVDKDDMVHLCDAESRVETFNTHTQLPLNRQDVLDEERDEWKAWAELLASSLNAALAAPAATGGEISSSPSPAPDA